MSTIEATEIGVAVDVLTCGKCGIVFAVPSWWVQTRRKDHATWYCPNGDARAFLGETKEEKRIRELEVAHRFATERARQAEKDAEIERKARKQVQKKLSATKGTLTKTRNRVANGVCPCCNRTFQNLARHMKGQHPGYAAEGA